MTREEALTTLAVLSRGLTPDDAGRGRLLERVSVHTEAELLRDLLTELGAEARLRADA